MLARVKNRLDTAHRAISTLDEVIERHAVQPDDVTADALIKRFEYSSEAVWKVAQALLQEVHARPVGSPRLAIEGSLAIGLLSDAEAEEALRMVQDRNVTVHVYGLDRVEEVKERVPGYARLLRRWLAAIEQSLEERA